MHTQKPASAVIDVSNPGAKIKYPTMTSNLHFEAELVVGIGERANRVDVAGAKNAIFGYAMGVDLTRRDLQNEAKKLKRPWCYSKGFDQSAPVGLMTLKDEFDNGGSIDDLSMTLSVNGEQKQNSKLGKMIWKCDEMIAKLSEFYQLEAGDVIMTGTPAGVGPLVKGDTVSAQCTGLDSCHFVME